MAFTKLKVRVTGMEGSDVKALAAQFNNLLDVLATWGGGFDTDSGVAATNHVSGLEAGVNKIADTDNTEL